MVFMLFLLPSSDNVCLGKRTNKYCQRNFSNIYLFEKARAVILLNNEIYHSLRTGKPVAQYHKYLIPGWKKQEQQTNDHSFMYYLFEKVHKNKKKGRTFTFQPHCSFNIRYQTRYHQSRLKKLNMYNPIH